MTTAAPAHGANPTRRSLVVLAFVVLFIPALITALLVATAARAEVPVDVRDEFGKDLSGE